MLIGVLLIFTWLILLLRYPSKALPVSLAAVIGLGLVAASVAWLDNREARQLARLELRITYAPGEFQGAATWHDCLPMPPLRAGYRPQTLEFRAERLQGSFSN